MSSAEDRDIEPFDWFNRFLGSRTRRYSDFQIVIFIMPNGDIYFDEPYSRQQVSTTTNLAFRDYFKGVIRTNDIYLGDPTPSASSGQMQSVIAIPIYSLKDNSTIAGVWSGGIDFGILNRAPIT